MAILNIIVRQVLSIIALSFTCLAGVAQISEQNEQQIEPIYQLNVQSMPNLINASLVEDELNQRAKNRAPNFAVPIEVNLNPKNSGKWEYLEDVAIWRLIVESPSAHSLNLGFTTFHLPKSSSLYIYDYYNQEKIRPFVPSDNDEHEQLWTPIISSDKLVIEVNIAKKEMDSLKLQLSYVNHDYMDIQKTLTDGCHIDVSCNAGNGYPGIDEYRDQIRSVGMYTIGGTSICSGFLINNTRQDCRPYFMTANHCNLTAFNASSMVTYWNYENSYCREPGSNASASAGDGVLNNFNSGAVLKSAWEDSDFTLVELDDEVPKKANAYFCGWDISSNPPDRGVVIHHPNLEEKRISFKYSTLYTGRWGQDATPVNNGDHLIVDHWDLGSTEDGSSGAPLFNRQGLVVGQLHGGLASCDNQGYDSFGRLFSSWTGGGTATNRLKDWLDPVNMGALSLEGKNCTFGITLSKNDFAICGSDGSFEVIVEVDDSFQGPVQLTFEALPFGAFAYFDQTVVQPGQPAKLSVSNLENLSAGDYEMNIVVQDIERTVKTRLRFEVFIDIGTIPLILFPEHQSSIDVDDAKLIWKESNIASAYKIQIATDFGFTANLIEKTAVEAHFDMKTFLEVNETYFWRVKSVNTCGESQWSFVNEFSSIDLICWEGNVDQDQTILSGEPNVIYSTIRNTTAGSVMSIELSSVKGRHSFVGDLQMSLISPIGTEVLLIKEECSSSKDFNFGFSDEGLVKIPCPFTDSSLYKPLESLARFNGESGLGEWVLKIEDTNNYDGGLLEEWSLDICMDPSKDFSLSADIYSLSICSNESYNILLFLGAGFDTDFPLSYESNIPSLAQVNTDGENVALQINSSGMASPGNYPIEVKVSDSFGHIAVYSLDLAVVLAPVSFDLLLPLDEELNVSTNVAFEWSSSTYASEYLIEISEDASFSDIQFAETVNSNIYTFNESFETGQSYFWRVTALNRCDQVVSPVNTFTVEKPNGVSQISVELVDIQPNPTQNFINISKKSLESVEDLEISIHSIDGKLYYQSILPTSSTVITVSNWPKGIYLVNAKGHAEVQMSRIVVQ